MVGNWWLPVPRSDLSQGDVLSAASIGVITSPIRFLRHETLSKGRGGWSESDQPVPRDNKVPMLAMGQVGAVVVLSHDCEIDKQQSRVIVAPILPISSLDAKTQQATLAGKIFALGPLPDVPGLGTHYFDFRSTTAVARAGVNSLTRVASLTDEGVKLLQARIFGFFTRREIP